MPDTSPATLAPGTLVGAYEILLRLGAGGMGVVYRARDPRLGRDVTLKLLPSHLDQSSDARERLRREARAVAALQHPNICTIYDVGDTELGQAYLVMELLAGETLQHRLARGSLLLEEAIDISVALAGAIAAAHDAGIIHRDLKPANIFLTSHGPKILDFGLAKSIAPSSPDFSTAALLTEPGVVVGTTAYMSPEQLRGLALDARTDVFSLGLVIYEMCTGVRAFTGDTAPVAAAAILHDQPKSSSAINRNIPAAIDACIMRAIEKPVELRFQSAADLRSALLHARAAAPPSPARSSLRTWPFALAGSAVLIIAIAAGMFLRRPPPPTLTERDTIVIADFKNATGDAVFDDALRQGLAVQLQQSPFLTVIPEARVRRTLLMMGRPADSALTADVTAEVCQRTGSTAYLEGSIAPLGSRYAVGLKATGCGDDGVIDQEQVEIDRKEDVLRAVGELAAAFRQKSGESLSSRQRFAKPLAEATTSSLDALKSFSTARRVSDTQGLAAAIPLFRRAVEIDPQFAVAWAMLGLNYSAISDAPAAINATTRAYELRQRTTDRERFLIEALYERQVTGNLDKARQTFENFCNIYPRDLDAHSLLSGFSTHGTGRYEEALAHADIARTLDPGFLYGHLNAVTAVFYLDRPGEARQRFDRARDAKVDIPDEFIWQYLIADVQQDPAVLADAAARGAASPASAEQIALLMSQRAARLQQWDDARVAIQRAITLAQGAGHPEAAAIYYGTSAIWETFGGHVELARKAADAALAFSSSRDVTYAAAFALARIGERPRAAALAASLTERFPEDTSVRFNYLPTLRALDALLAREPAKAVAVLEEARPYETALPALAFMNYMGWSYPMFVRGEAFEALGRHAEAAAEFRRILSHRGLLQTDPIAAVVARRLADLSGR